MKKQVNKCKSCGSKVTYGRQTCDACINVTWQVFYMYRGMDKRERTMMYRLLKSDYKEGKLYK